MTKYLWNQEKKVGGHMYNKQIKALTSEREESEENENK